MDEKESNGIEIRITIDHVKEEELNAKWAEIERIIGISVSAIVLACVTILRSENKIDDIRATELYIANTVFFLIFSILSKYKIAHHEKLLLKMRANLLQSFGGSLTLSDKALLSTYDIHPSDLTHAAVVPDDMKMSMNMKHQTVYEIVTSVVNFAFTVLR